MNDAEKNAENGNVSAGVHLAGDDQVQLEVREPLLQLFRWKHLPPHLQAVSRPFGELAAQLVRTLPSNRERSTALRKLREAKDCAVTALIFVEPPRS